MDTRPIHHGGSVTVLPGRTEFRQKLEDCIRSSQEGQVVGVVVLKLKRLRDINLEFGYEFGDALLSEIARRLSSCLRPNDFLARTGCTEFAVILPALPGTGVPLLAAQKFLRVCTDRFEFKGRYLKPSLSAGVSSYPDDATTAELLLRKADAALRHAHLNGSEVVAHIEFEPFEDQTDIQLERAFEAALDRSELFMHFQPKVDLETGCVTGMEALSRWSTDDGREVPPDRFVKLAERVGLIVPLALWNFDTALRECRQWQSALPGVSVAINLSPTLLTEPELPELVRQALALWELPPELLTLEITESAMMSEDASTLDALRSLRDLGVRLALDDFGTGYSSLAYLRKLPVQEIKIDAMFVGDMLSNEEDRCIVQTVIDLAQNFNLTVVAEGPEDEDTLDALAFMGCSQVQGYIVGRPMAAEAIVAWLEGSPWKIGAGRTRAASS